MNCYIMDRVALPCFELWYNLADSLHFGMHFRHGAQVTKAVAWPVESNGLLNPNNLIMNSTIHYIIKSFNHENTAPSIT